jgi:oligoendopeptidase F
LGIEQEDRIHEEMIPVQKKEVLWDLSEMFPSTTDPSIQKTIDNLTRSTENFVKKYQGKIKQLLANELLECIRSYEEYLTKLNSLTTFAGLSFSANMTLPETQSLRDRVDKTRAELEKMMAFFDIELGHLIYENPKIVNEDVLRNYRHFLETFVKKVPHQLSESEEKLVIEKDQFGISAWRDLQRVWLNTRTFEVEVKGEKRAVPFGEALGLTHNSDRSTRISATKSIGNILARDGEVFSSALRNITNDWVSICNRRKYNTPMEASLIDNDVYQQVIDNLLKTIENSTGLLQRFLRLKAKIMKLPKLSGWHDIFAPLPDAPDAKFDYDKARTLIIEAYERFDEDYAFTIRDMFSKNHIDATPRQGKRDNAFCWDWYEGKTSYILLNFSETLFDIYTLAHELGHAVHTHYYTHYQTILNGSTNLSMAIGETASIFGELLLTDLLLDTSESVREEKAIICRVLDAANLNIYIAASRLKFEQALYDAIKRGEYLDFKTTCRHWADARSMFFGDAIEWLEEAQAQWAIATQFYMPNFRFYNYPYVYSQMFVYALYQLYLKEGKRFVPKFKEALSAGCSVSPVEIGKIFGVDVTDTHFWELGLKQYEYFIKELEKIAT